MEQNVSILEIRFENCRQPPQVVLKFREIVSEILVKWIAPTAFQQNRCNFPKTGLFFTFEKRELIIPFGLDEAYTI